LGRLLDEARRAKSKPKAELERGGVLGGSKSPPHQLAGLGEHYKHPSRVRGGSPTAQIGFLLFSALRMAYPDTIILITDHKN